MVDTPPRPLLYADEFTLAAAKMLVPAVMRWLGPDAKHVSDDELAKDIAEAADGLDDGYEIAREMENRRRYDPDAELVEILGMMLFHRMDAYEEAVKAWAAANAVDPGFAIGDRVSTPHGPGSIARIMADQAKYLVKLDQRDGAGEGYIGTHVEFERTKIEEATDADAVR